MPQLFDDVIFALGPVTINGVVYHGGKTPWGLLRTTLSDQTYGTSPLYPVTTIVNYALDPPVPPVWPVLGAGKYSSDTIYGSERMNTNLTFVRGDTYVLTATAVLNGVVVDLSGGTLKLTCKKNLNNSSPFFQITSPSSGIVITSPASGAFTATIAGALTSSLPAYTQRLPYDIEYTDTSSGKHTLVRGNLIIIPDVTI